MKYDVFISYAHVDDAPLVKGEPGWVTTLVTTLRMLLAQKLPRRDDQPAKAEVWMDPRLRGHGDLDVEIAQALEQSATLLIVLSSAYVNAPYCALEFKTFLRLAGERALDRVFVVEYDQARRPEELRPLRGYSFWSADALAGTSRPIAFPLPDADEVDYYARLWDLSAQMAAQVQRMRAAEGAEPELAPAPEGVEPSGRPVYLADTTDDLDADRDRIRRYLNQAGFRVVPEGWYPRDDPERYAAAAARDMAEARLFVQLLGPVPGRRPPTLPEGYAALQCRLAEAARLEVVQWRPRDLDPGTVADPHLRTLLERPTVQATGLEEFKRNVVELLRRPPPPPAAAAPGELKLVFVNNDRTDQELAHSILQALEARKVGASIMLSQGSPEEMREYLQANLVSCDGLIMVYGGTSQAWLISQVQEYRKARARRERDIQAWAVYEGPPPEKGELAFRFPNLKVINCRQGFSAEALEEFITGLAAEAAQ